MKSLSIIRQTPKSRAITALLLMSLLCLLLACARIYLSKNYTYFFLVWNLFLAWIPLFFAHHAHRNYFGDSRNLLLILPYGFFWMIFFPNAPYIITDLIHLEGRHLVPIWFDALLLFSFALTGLLIGYISLFFIHSMLEHHFNKLIGWLAVFFMMLLSAYGIFLGRVLRFNSWDIFSQPFGLMNDCIETFGNMQALKMTVIFFLFLIFSYYILYNIIFMNHNHKQRYDH
jgi:uncharacterized membrane protein